METIILIYVVVFVLWINSNRITRTLYGKKQAHRTTKSIVRENNAKLLKALIPDGTETIYGTVTDINDFNNPIK